MREPKNKNTSQFTKEELGWIFRVIKESLNIRGSDLPIAVKTVKRIQEFLS